MASLKKEILLNKIVIQFEFNRYVNLNKKMT